MLANREKAVLVIEICVSQATAPIQNVLKLLDILIQETRIDNDTADADGVKRNQGGIAKLLEVREYILRGIPSMNKTA